MQAALIFRIFLGGFNRSFFPSNSTHYRTMYFCPSCANMLLIDESIGGNSLSCQTCPYIYKIQDPLSQKKQFTRKTLDDILGGQDQWENVDQADATCPKCEHNRAYFMQIQTRSADEPMTTFYKCVKCSRDWKEN